MSVLALITTATLFAAPTKPLPAIEGPLGRFDRIVEQEGGASSGNSVYARYELASCSEVVMLNLTTVVAGLGRVLQQLDEWLSKTPGLEQKLFGKKGAVALRYRQLMGSTQLGSESCEKKELQTGLRKGLFAKAVAPCSDSEAGKRSLGNYWFGTGSDVMAFVAVARAAADTPEGCGLDLRSTVPLAGGRSQLIVALGPDVISAQVVGLNGQCIDFAEEKERNRLRATQRSCKK